MKRCSKCKEFKSLEFFDNSKAWNDGKYPQCKQCRLEYYQKNKEERIRYNRKYYREHKEDYAQHYQKNKEKINQQHREWLKENKEYQKKWYREHKKETAQYNQEHKEERNKYNREYQQKNKKKRNLYLKTKRISDFNYKLNDIISCGIRSSFKSGNGKQGRCWESLVPYTLTQLKKHLKRTISEGYTWKDFMQGKLHIDHILPKAIFKYEKTEDLDFQICWGLDNLRIIPVKKNLSKGVKLIKPFQKTFAMEIKLRDKCVSPT